MICVGFPYVDCTGSEEAAWDRGRGAGNKMRKIPTVSTYASMLC